MSRAGGLPRLGGMTRRILVIGGGYAGLLFANRLARKTRAADAQIVLASARPWFVERVRLHEDAAGHGPARRALASMVDPRRVTVRLGTVESVDFAAQRASFAEGPTEAFDELVLATGSVQARPPVPGFEHARSCANEEEALALQAELGALPHAARVVVVGGGSTGIELATELGDQRRDLRVTLVTSGDVGACVSPAAQQHIRAVCTRMNIELREHARVVAVERDGVVLASGDAVPAAITIGCGGFVPSPLAGALGLAVDAIGRALVDDQLRSTSHVHVRVIGDAARVDPGARGAPLRMACATALPQAAFCSDAIARELAGDEARAFSFAYLVQCLSLGRREGLVQYVDPWDAPRRLFVKGRVAAWIKELICRYAAGSPRLERRGIGYSWPKAPARLPAPAPDPHLLATRDS